MKSILALELKKIGLGYRLLNDLGSFIEKNKIDVVEASPQPTPTKNAPSFLLILQGENAKMFGLKKHIEVTFDSEAIEKTLFLQEASEDLLKSLYSLNEVKLSEGFVIIETRSTLDSLELGDLLLERGCELIEIKSKRRLLSYSYIIATGKKEKLEKIENELTQREPFKSLVQHLELIQDPQKHFTDWF